MTDIARGPSPSRAPQPWSDPRATALLLLDDGTVVQGFGLGAEGVAAGELCFNTAMTGYQEVLTDPSYAGQIITFTTPHIGNVGANVEDIETSNAVSSSSALGLVFRAPVTEPSNYRAANHFSDWLARRGIIGIAGVDTRALTVRIRDGGMPNVVIAHAADGQFDMAKLHQALAAFPGMDGLDLAPLVTCGQSYTWDETTWAWGQGYGRQTAPHAHVVAIDYGLKRNILRCLAAAGCRITVVPATATVDDVLAHKPDGVFLSNGPGDPAATGRYAVPVIAGLIDRGLPVFGICLGHQMLALALGARTEKMHQGHHGANHPVKDHTTGKVEITSMNHGFAVARDSLPAQVEETHVSLFDGSNCGIRLKGRPVFSVQYHPEASPGPQDSHYLFTRFVHMIAAAKAA